MPVQLRAFNTFPDDPTRVLITSTSQLDQFWGWLRTKSEVVIDYETTGLAWYKGCQSIGTAVAAFEGDTVWAAYIPYRHQTPDNQLSFDQFRPYLREILENPQVMKINHNLKFEDHFTRRDGMRILGPRFDTMIAARLFDENFRLQLEFRAERDLGLGDAAWTGHRLMSDEISRMAKDRKMGREAYVRQYGYAEVSAPLTAYYACGDVISAAMLKRFYTGRGVPTNYPRIWNTEMELTRVLCDMEQNGLLVDTATLVRIQSEAGSYCDAISQWVRGSLRNPDFKINSDDHVRDFLERCVGIELSQLTEKGQKSVDSHVLESYADRHPVIRGILDYREAHKLMSTYTQSIIDRLDDQGYVHGNLKQVGTNTGRLSCEDPNYQNFPSDSDDRAKKYSGKKVEDGGIDPWSIRRAFPCRPGHVRLFLDYSQIELRVLAFRSKDPILMDAYSKGEDVHDRTATEIGVVVGEKLPRRVAKVINFGLCISGNQLVLTDKGLVRLDEVSDRHKVWDGLEWVCHGGLICRGEQEVMEWGGLTATPDHEVYTDDGRRISIREAASSLCPGRLAIGAIGATPVGYSAFDGVGWVPRETSDGEGHVRGVLEMADFIRGQREVWKNQKLHVSGEISGFESRHPRSALRCDDPEVPALDPCVIEALQRQGDPGFVSISGTLYSLGVGEIPRFGFSGNGARSNQQRRALQPEESEVNHIFGKQQKRPTLEKVRVYDLLDAGPRHRFCVSGKIVSNSYGMSAGGVARNTGVSYDDADKFLKAFFLRYTGVKRYRHSLVAEAISQGCMFQNMWGRPRRLPELVSAINEFRGRAERQTIATDIQGTAAELTKESLVRVDAEFRRHGIPAMLVNTVHDEIQIDVPLEYLKPAAIVAKAAMEYYPEFFPLPIIADAEWSEKTWADKQDLILT